MLINELGSAEIIIKKGQKKARNEAKRKSYFTLPQIAP